MQSDSGLTDTYSMVADNRTVVRLVTLECTCMSVKVKGPYPSGA